MRRSPSAASAISSSGKPISTRSFIRPRPARSGGSNLSCAASAEAGVPNRSALSLINVISVSRDGSTNPSRALTARPGRSTSTRIVVPRVVGGAVEPQPEPVVGARVGGDAGQRQLALVVDHGAAAGLLGQEAHAGVQVSFGPEEALVAGSGSSPIGVSGSMRPAMPATSTG